MGQQIQKRESNSLVERHGSRLTFWRVFGSAALILALAGLIVNLPDIKRYIRISTM